MWAGPPRMRSKAALLLALLASPVAAEPADCPALAATLEALTGYHIVAPKPVRQEGWCVYAQPLLQSPGAPDLAAKRLRLRGERAEGDLATLAFDAGGIRVAPGFGQRDLAPLLRETLRLQTVDLTFEATAGAAGLALRQGRLRLSGGTDLAVEADLAGAGFSAGSLLSGRVTWARLDWRNDGKFLRPALEHWGKGLSDPAPRGTAVDAARQALQQLLRNLPAAFFQDKAQERLERVIDLLPQGRGRLVLELAAPQGIGAAEVAVAALSREPLGPEALARLFAKAQLSVAWQPGLAP